MAKVQVIIALCVIATVLISMIAVNPVQAGISCTVDEENCDYCCHTMNGYLWTATLDEGVCSCSKDGVTETMTTMGYGK